jgi:hypothetical protein
MKLRRASTCFGGVTQPQGDDRRGGAEVVELPSAPERGVGEEPFEGGRPHGVETVDAGADDDVRDGVVGVARRGVQKHLQIAGRDDADVYPTLR